MPTNCRTSRGHSRLSRGFIALCIQAALLAGCQREASKGDAQTEQAGSPVIQAQPSEPEEAASADRPAVPAKPANTAEVGEGPRITVDELVVDLGEVGTDSKRTGEFRFKNTGNAPLEILDVHSCCGVVTRGVKAGQKYAPGQSGVLEFDFLAGSTPVSKWTRELRLQTNDPTHNLVSLAIKASVVRRVSVDPLRLVLLLKRENADCHDVTIRSLDGKPFSIAAARSTANAIAIDFDPNVKATEFVLKPRVDMEKLQTNLKGTISIDLTHPECTNVRVLFDVLPEFTVNPQHLMIFNMRPDQPVQREVWILSNYCEDFELESVSSQNGRITLLEKKKVGNRYQLQIEVKVPPKEGDNTIAADVLNVKIKDGPTVSIPFRGFYVGG